MLKKILILSFRNPFNYGAELQVFALGKKLRMLGYNVEVLDLARPNFDTDACPSKLLKRHYNDTFKSRLIVKLSFFKRRLFWALHWKRSKLKFQLSNEFHDHYNSFTTHRYRNFDELYTVSLDYTHYIVGSDQVWNYEYPFSLDPYFLSFVKKGKKIAYAASIGTDNQTVLEELRAKYKYLISSYKSSKSTRIPIVVSLHFDTQEYTNIPFSLYTICSNLPPGYNFNVSLQFILLTYMPAGD